MIKYDTIRTANLYVSRKKGIDHMARKTNYDAKIAKLEEKIKKRKNEIKSLKDELEAVEAQKTEDDNKVLLEYMREKNLTAEEVLSVIKD